VEIIQHWKSLQRLGNQAFNSQQLEAAAQYYLHSILLLKHHLPMMLQQHRHGCSLMFICLSIAVQNLAEVYAKQQRWRRRQLVLNRAMQQFHQLQQQLPAEHPAQLTLLREGSHIRRALFYSDYAIKNSTPSYAGHTMESNHRQPWLH
jgi:hypothetical protein